MSRSAPSEIEVAKSLLNHFFQRYVVAAVIGAFAGVIVGYALPFIIGNLIGKGLRLDVSVHQGLVDTAARLSAFTVSPSLFLYSLGVPLLGAAIAVVIAVAKAEDF